MATSLEIKAQESGKPGYTVVALEGEIDESSLPRLKEFMEPLADSSGLKGLVMDLENLEFINSKGIGYLVSLHAHLTHQGRSFALANAREAVMDVMGLVGLTQIIPYYATPKEALQKLTG